MLSFTFISSLRLSTFFFNINECACTIDTEIDTQWMPKQWAIAMTHHVWWCTNGYTPICLHADLSYLQLVLVLHAQHCSTQKSIRQDYSIQDKSNLVTSLMVVQESLGTRLEDWAMKDGGHTWNSCHTTNTKINYNSNICRFCTSTVRKSLPRPPLGLWER